MKKLSVFLSAILLSVMSFAQTVPTNEELWEAFKPYYITFYGEERADQPITAVATFMTQGEKIFTDATSEYKWLGDYLVMIATEQGFSISSEALWRWHADAFFQANQHTSWPKSADFTEAGKPENWGPYYLAAQGSTTPEVTTVELAYELTNENVLDRMGRRTVYTTDDVLGDVQIILPTFNAETTEYTDASLVVGDATLAATATYAADAENNKEVYTATATSEDGATVYNVTMTVTYPATQEYTFFAMDDAEATVEDWGEEGEPFMVYMVAGAGMLDEEPVEFELMIDQLNNLEGMIGEAFVMGTATSLYEEEGNLAVSGTAMDDAGNTYNIELWVPLAGGEVEIVITEEVDVTLYNLNLDVQGNMAMVTAGGETGVSFWLANLSTLENYYGYYFSDAFSNIWYGDAQLQPYGDGQYSPDGLIVSFISTPDAEGNAVKYNFTLIAGDEPVVVPEQVYTENKLNTYASGLTSTLEGDVLKVNYVLNNSNATSVNVLVYNGEEVVATVAGTTTIGKNTVEVATADLPQGVQLTWGVEVNGTSVTEPTQETKLYSLYHPSSVDIDNNPENPTFGLILANEAMHKVKNVDGYLSTGYGAGIYAFTPSFDPIANGDQAGFNGGNEFVETNSTGTSYAPRRIRISDDGRIFVTSLDVNGTYLWELNPANLNEWTPVFTDTQMNDLAELIDAEGNFVAGPNAGFDVRGAGENLQLLMLSGNTKAFAFAPNGFKCAEYNLGTATSWTGAPSRIIWDSIYALVPTQSQVQYDADGGVWFAQYRGTTTEDQPGMVHWTAEGVEDFKWLRDMTRNAGIRYDGEFAKMIVAGNNGAAKKATLYNVTKDENGAPVLTEELVIDMAVVGNNLNDFAFDYAGNLYALGHSAEKIVAWAMPYSGQVVTPAAAQYAFTVGTAVEPVEMVGVVKRALQYYDATIVLTHEADGTPHIYNLVDGVVAEVSQEGVVPVDPENASDFLAISDIALTEDGKLVATNYMVTQSADDQVVAGDKRGETRIYIWDDLAGTPSILFTSKMSSNWFQSKQGLTMAVKGTSDNMEILMTGIHKSKAWARVSSYRVIDGVYTEPDVNHNDHYFFYDVADAVALETTVGTQYELTASPLGAMNWILDAELINPVEIVEPETNNVEISSCVALSQDLGKKYQGVSVVTVGEQVLMVAPYATEYGVLAGAKVLDITNGLDAAEEVTIAYLDSDIEATAAATAVQVVEGGLVVTLVADATIYTLNVELATSQYPVIEDAINNLVFDLEAWPMVCYGGPSDAFQIEVYLVLGEDNGNGQFSLTSESSIAVLGQDATFISGYITNVDVYAPSATAVIVAQLQSGEIYEFHIAMTAAPVEAIDIVIEDATVAIDTIPLFGDVVDYALRMTADWTNPADGVTYPVSVEIPVYYPEATEPSSILSTVTIGGWGDTDPWLGFGEGELNVVTVDGVVTAQGTINNPGTGFAANITISGKLPQDPGPGTGLDNVQVEVNTVKTIKNGQLIIVRDGKEYNAQGAVVK